MTDTTVSSKKVGRAGALARWRIGVTIFAGSLGLSSGCFNDPGGDAEETGTSDETETEADTDEHEPMCGDGIKESWEACDDGNSDNSDECVECEVAICGDGFIQEGVEACDDGNADNSDACTHECVFASCGDGYWQLGNHEECDDGNTVDDDGCTNECELVHCGNGTLEEPEQCDDDNEDNNDGCSDICRWEWRNVFVTSAVYDGDLGGHDGADAKCAQLAGAANLPGEYRAWLSTSTVSAADHLLENSDVEYRNMGGEKIAANWDDLVSGTLDAAILYDENGMMGPLYLGSFCQVWTGTNSDGTSADLMELCTDWSLADDLNVGKTGDCETLTGWTSDGYAEPCSELLPIYCIQD